MSDSVVTLRATHVVAGLQAAHGGPSYSVPRLCYALREEGVDAQLFSGFGKGQPPPLDPATAAFTHLFREDMSHAPFVSQFRFSSALNAALSREAAHADILHNHGLWLAPNVHAGRAAQRGRSALIISPRGMLSRAALSFSPLRKKLIWAMLQGPASRRAACWHATSVAEADDIRAFGVTAPIAVVPNGVDIPLLQPTREADTRAPTILYVGRLHAKKNLRILLEAWAELSATLPEWRLRIVGPDEDSHAKELTTHAAKLGARNVSIESPAYGAERIKLMQNASIFVLPSLNENFGLTVAEALACGLPVIATNGTPWSGLEENGCGYWIAPGVRPLAEALKVVAMMTQQARADMGARGRQWVARDFAWQNIGRKMTDVYNWVARRAECPDFVRT